MPMSAPLPAEELTATRHLLHTKFGQELAHLVILRGAKVAHAFAKANLPTKPMVTSLAGSIYPLMIQEGVKSYTESLHNSKVPTFTQLASLPVPAGYQRSDPHCWYRPWVKVSPAAAASPLPGEPGTSDISEDTEPILRMAGSSTTDSRGVRGQSQSLLGYFWDPRTDHISRLG